MRITEREKLIANKAIGYFIAESNKLKVQFAKFSADGDTAAKATFHQLENEIMVAVSFRKKINKPSFFTVAKRFFSNKQFKNKYA